MDVMNHPRTPAHGPYNHLNNHLHHHNFHHTDQTKSLQELQNEVGALLEFRDLVIETFPDLKHKMSSSGANSTITGLQSSSIVSRREWEPGIRVRRKLNSNHISKEGSSGNGVVVGDIQSTSLLCRSRSNSHSGKKEPKSGGEGNGSVIQDSGFSTETSSSKEAHSASSTAGSAGVQGNNISSTLNARLSSDASGSGDNELWNLLDVIHRRTSRLADEIDNYQKFSNRNIAAGQSPTLAVSSGSGGGGGAASFQSQLNYVSKENVHLLRKERDSMMDKMGDMEAEVLATRIKESKLQEQILELHETKAELEEKLKAALSHKYELHRHNEFDVASSSELSKTRTSSDAATFQPIAIKPQRVLGSTGAEEATTSKQLKNELNQLGRLDGLISNPGSRLNKVRVPDSKKIAAILLETNIVELQRHLLTITIQNQVLQQKLELATKSKIYLIKKLDKSKEEVEDLKFQIEERNIELEGTRAQLRVMESKLANRSDSSPDHHSTRLSSHDGITIMHTSTPNNRQTISTPSMKAMIPLTMLDEGFQHSSSTESAHDQQERDLGLSKCPETPRRSNKPSKIPLPGTKGFVAKPPSGRGVTPSNRSLTKSTSSLYNGQKSCEHLSIGMRPKDASLTRPDSVQSWRNISIENNNNHHSGSNNTSNLSKSRSSSIPISSSKPIISISSSPIGNNSPPSAYGSTTVVNIPSGLTSSSKYVTSSPLPRSKRDSLTTKVKNLDSLSRLQTSSAISGSTGALSRSTSSHNAVTNGTSSSRKHTALPVRRMSNVSVGRDNELGLDSSSNDNGSTGKAFARNIIDRFGNHQQISIDSPLQSDVMKKSATTSHIDCTYNGLIREYLQKARSPNVPEILKAENNRRHSTPPDIDFAYKHPLMMAEELKIGCDDEAEAEDQDDSDRKIGNNNYDNSSIIIPRPIRAVKSIMSSSSEERPHLIGRVRPSIARTWEQITNAMDMNLSLDTESRVNEHDEDKQSYVLFVRKAIDFQQLDNDKYAVNKMQHTVGGISEKFFDSIDNDDDELNGEEEYEIEAGEEMAQEIDSLELRCNDLVMWSIES